MSLLLQKLFLANCISVCTNHIISSYLDLHFTGVIAHHHFLYITSFPICIFWSNFHLAGLLPLVMASEMESDHKFLESSPVQAVTQISQWRKQNSSETESDLPEITQKSNGGAGLGPAFVTLYSVRDLL